MFSIVLISEMVLLLSSTAIMAWLSLLVAPLAKEVAIEVTYPTDEQERCHKASSSSNHGIAHYKLDVCSLSSSAYSPTSRDF